MLLGHMEESCPHSLNQERDSIKRHLFKCATECRKSLTNTYRQENKHSLRVSVRTIGRHEIQVLVVQRKKLMIFLNFNLQLNMRSSWFSQMDQPDGFFFFFFYLRSGIQRQDLESTSPIFSPPVNWWERNMSQTNPRLYQTVWIIEPYSETKHPTVRARQAH